MSLVDYFSLTPQKFTFLQKEAGLIILEIQE